MTIGYDGTQSEIGSIAGRMQGTVENCVSHTTVKGVNYVGGIIGYYRSLNKFDNISNNIYASDCGATKGIAAVQYVDTNQFANLTEKDGTTYFNTSKMEINRQDTNTLYLYANDGTLMKGPTVRRCDWKADHNRTDDPLGKDAVKLCRSTNESLLPDDNGAGTPGNTPATGDTGVLVWAIALPVTILAAAFVLKRKEREA